MVYHGKMDFRYLLLTLTLVFLAPSAQAAIVALEEVQFISGTEGVVFEFDITVVGEYTATLTDFAFPSAFDTLMLQITTATDSLGTLVAPGSFSFVAASDTYFASIFGIAGGNFDTGSFGVEVASDMVPIPLPPAIWLLGTAVIALISVRRLEGR